MSTKSNEVFCPEHQYAGAKFIPTPHTVHYGKMVCPKCERFLSWAKKPEESKRKNAQSFTLGGQEFPTKTALTDYIKTVLAQSPLNAPLTNDAADVVTDLFKLHPESDTKIGAGIDRVEVRINREFAGNSRGFWIVRADGTETDISYKKCLEGETVHRNQFIKACRATIKPHIEYFRREFFRVATTPTCCLTGQPVQPNTCHVDHTPPYTFERIIDAFAALHGLDLNAPGLCVSGVDGWLLPSLADDILRDKFVQFHNTFAQLRVISVSANTNLVPKSVIRGNHELQASLFQNGAHAEVTAG
jgi:hypothetical protein